MIHPERNNIIECVVVFSPPKRVLRYFILFFNGGFFFSQDVLNARLDKRTDEMLKRGLADELCAFKNELAKSTGTNKWAAHDVISYSLWCFVPASDADLYFTRAFLVIAERREWSAMLTNRGRVFKCFFFFFSVLTHILRSWRMYVPVWCESLAWGDTSTTFSNI